MQQTRLPVPKVSDERGAFLTHANYIQALDFAMASRYHPNKRTLLRRRA
jgi:hypothetical protein